MKKILILLIAISIYACKKNDLKSEFNCESSTTYAETKEIRDILKKFRITLPTNWKTQLYYDDYQSEIYSADTTKGLSETFIVDVSWHQGELFLDEAFEQKVRDTLAIKEKLSTVKTNYGEFKKYPSYYNLSKGINAGYPYHYLQVYIKTEIDEYFTFTTKVYGSNNIEERLCESIALFEQIEIIN